ncbi:unnamed protein product [Auanema sp. JU1783]|nr:unnamed protein product [Auanema sp. JU1783]
MRPVLFITLCCLVCTVMAGLAGGWTNQNASDSDYMKKAWGASEGINDNASNNGPYHMMPIKVLSAKSQVVAGTKHELEVLYGESSCKKGEMQAIELSSSNCQLRDGAARHIYKVTVWEKPWENFEQFNFEKVRNVEPSEQF